MSVSTGSATELFVVNLKVFKTATVLAPPLIPAQDFSTKLGVRMWVEPHNGTFCLDRGHEAFWFACVRNLCFCPSGKNL